MNILVVASWYPGRDNSVRGSFFRLQASALAAAGHDVTVLVPERYSPRSLAGKGGLKGVGRRGFTRQDEGAVRVYRNESIRLLPAGIFPIATMRGMVNDSLRLLKDLIAERGPFDIIHAQSAYWAGAIAMAISDLAGVPYIIQEHRSNFLSGKLAVPAKAKLRDVFKKASVVTAVSERLLSVVAGEYGVPKEKASILQNMVNTAFFKECGKAKTDQFRFGMVARLHSIKRYDIALRAFSIVLGRYPDVELHIVGSGKSREKLEALSVDLGIERHVIWHGSVEPAGLPGIMATFDSLVLSSDHETFGVVLAEAWACGIPVVATRCGGPDYMVTPGNGILVEKGNAEALATSMCEMIDRRGQYSSAAIRAEAASVFSEAAIVKKTMEIYSMAVARYRTTEGS